MVVAILCSPKKCTLANSKSVLQHISARHPAIGKPIQDVKDAQIDAFST